MTIDLSGNVVPRYMGAHGSLTMKPTKLFGSTPGAQDICGPMWVLKGFLKYRHNDTQSRKRQHSYLISI